MDSCGIFESSANPEILGGPNLGSGVASANSVLTSHTSPLIEVLPGWKYLVSYMMPPSFDDSSFIVVGDLFEDDDDGSLSMGDDHSPNQQPEKNGDIDDGTLILPSANETFTPPSSVDSDIASLDFEQKRLLVPDDDDDMEGIDDPLALVSPPANVDADILPSKVAHEEPTLIKNNTSWESLLQDIQDTLPSTPRRRSLFLYLPILVAFLAIATYTKHLDSLRLREIQMANKLRELEHQHRIIQLQQEIEKLKKQQSSFSPNLLAEQTLSWLFDTMEDPSEATTRSIMNHWTAFKKQARTTVDYVRTTVEKDVEVAKGWWKEQQQFVIEKLKEEKASRSAFKDFRGTPPSEVEPGTDAADSPNEKPLMPSKQTILVSVAVVSVASVLLGAAIDSFFGQSTGRIADYETFDPFGVPLADFVE